MKPTPLADTLSTTMNTPTVIVPSDSIAPSPLRPLPATTTVSAVPSIDSLLALPSEQTASKASPFSSPNDIPLPLLQPSQVELPATEGFTGTPRPYTLRTDDGVTALLLLCGLLVARVVTTSRHHIGESLKAFFRAAPQVDNHAERTGSEMRGRLLLFLEVSFCCGLLYYDYIHLAYQDLDLPALPYVTIGLSAGIVLLYIALKFGLYALVNSVFFSHDRAEQWVDSYLLIYLFVGITVLPVTLLAVFFDYPIEQQVPVVIGLIAAAKLLLLYRMFRIFCGKILDSLHIILYFCTLEIVPALVLWRALFWLNTNMSAIL